MPKVSRNSGRVRRQLEEKDKSGFLSIAERKKLNSIKGEQPQNNNNNNANDSSEYFTMEDGTPLIWFTTQGKATPVATTVFGPHILNAAKEKHPKLTIRKLFDAMPAPDQCKNVKGNYSVNASAKLENPAIIDEKMLGARLATLASYKDGITHDVLKQRLDIFNEETVLQENTNENTCWICGEAIVGKATSENDFGLAPECEHILPVMQAALFLELYGKKHSEMKKNMKKAITVIKNTKNINARIIEALDTYLRIRPEFKSAMHKMLKEYAWAHAGCNRIKSNKSFLIPNETATTVTISYPMIQAFLKEIFMDSKHTEILNIQKNLQDKYLGDTSAIKALDNGILHLTSGLNAFMAARLPIFKEKLEIICFHINQCIPGDPSCKHDIIKICKAGALDLVNKTGEYSDSIFEIIKDYDLIKNTGGYLAFCDSLFPILQTKLKSTIESLKSTIESLGAKIAGTTKILYDIFLTKEIDRLIDITNLSSDIILHTYVYVTKKLQQIAGFDGDQFINEFSNYLQYVYFYIVRTKIADSPLLKDYSSADYITQNPIFVSFISTVLKKSRTVKAFRNNLEFHFTHLSYPVRAINNEHLIRNLLFSEQINNAINSLNPENKKQLVTQISLARKPDTLYSDLVDANTKFDKIKSTSKDIDVQQTEDLLSKYVKEKADIFTVFIQSAEKLIPGRTMPIDDDEIQEEIDNTNTGLYVSELAGISDEHNFASEVNIFDNITIDDLYNNDTLAANLLLDVSERFAADGTYNIAKMPPEMAGAMLWGLRNPSLSASGSASGFYPAGSAASPYRGGKRSPKKSTIKHRPKRHIKTRKHRKVRK